MKSFGISALLFALGAYSGCAISLVKSVNNGTRANGQYWKLNIVTQGGVGHWCSNGFRFKKYDGTYGVPIAVSAQSSGNMYSQAAMEGSFNVNNVKGAMVSSDGTTLLNMGHWCIWGNGAEITVEFADVEGFESYLFNMHLNSCQYWPSNFNMQRSADGVTWETVHTESSSCPNPGSAYGSTQVLINEFTLPVEAPPTGTGGGGAAVGDPHLQNVHGERFDLMKEGRHVLISIPRGKDAEDALLRVQADARRLGGHCADLYFQELNITGSWAEAKKAGGYHYSVSQEDLEAPAWIVFGKVELKVAHGRTDGGLLYLNVYVKHLRRAGFAIGGLLGEDDHEDVITPPEACAGKMALLDSEGDRRSIASLAAASFE